MNQASKIVSGSILGHDCEVVMINGKRYDIPPPTIHRIAGAAYYLSDIRDCKTIRDTLLSINDVTKAANALSFFICGDTSLSEELSDGKFDEIITGIEKAYSLISAKNFTRLSVLARSIANLTAKPKL